MGMFDRIATAYATTEVNGNTLGYSELPSETSV